MYNAAALRGGFKINIAPTEAYPTAQRVAQKLYEEKPEIAARVNKAVGPGENVNDIILGMADYIAMDILRGVIAKHKTKENLEIFSTLCDSIAGSLTDPKSPGSKGYRIASNYFRRMTEHDLDYIRGDNIPYQPSVLNRFLPLQGGPSSYTSKAMKKRGYLGIYRAVNPVGAATWSKEQAQLRGDKWIAAARQRKTRRPVYPNMTDPRPFRYAGRTYPQWTYTGYTPLTEREFLGARRGMRSKNNFMPSDFDRVLSGNLSWPDEFFGESAARYNFHPELGASTFVRNMPSVPQGAPSRQGAPPQQGEEENTSMDG